MTIGDAHKATPLFIDAPPINNQPPVVLYCDFDGVLNPFLFTNIKVDNIKEHTYKDIKNLPPIPRTTQASIYGNFHYAVDYYTRVQEAHEEGLLYTPIHQTTVKAKPPTSESEREFLLHWSPEMISPLLQLIDNGLIEFRWCTTWNTEANKILAPLLGLPQSPQVPLNPPGFFSRNWNVEKYWWVHDLHSHIDPDRHSKRWVESVINSHGESLLEDPRPFIWIDDIATARFHNEHLYGEADIEIGQDVDPEKLGNDMLHDDYLIIRTHEAIGITKNQMTNIINFVNKFSSP